MKTAFVTVMAAALLAVACADHSMANDQTMRLRVDVGAASILERPVSVVNKNNLIMDNNTMTAKSNVMMTQNDRVVLRKKIEAMAMSADPKDDAAVLSRDVMRVVSDKDTDKVTMSKASAVVAAARSDDKRMVRQRITNLLISAAGKSSQGNDDSDDATDLSSSSDSSDVSSDADTKKEDDQEKKNKPKKKKSDDMPYPYFPPAVYCE